MIKPILCIASVVLPCVFQWTLLGPKTSGLHFLVCEVLVGALEVSIFDSKFRANI